MLLPLRYDAPLRSAVAASRMQAGRWLVLGLPVSGQTLSTTFIAHCTLRSPSNPNGVWMFTTDEMIETGREHALPHWVRGSLFFLAFGFAFALLTRSRTADLDMFHEMALIREALLLGYIPLADTFAYTPTVYPVVHHEWGTGAVLYLIAVASGLGGPGIMGLWVSLVSGTAAFSFYAARLRGATRLTIGVLAPVAVLLIGPGLSAVRAHLFSFLFLAVLLALLEKERQGNRWWPAVWLPVYMLWVNMHGGFVVGAGLFAAYTLERFLPIVTKHGLSTALRATRLLLAVGLAMGLLTLVNPYGWSYIPYLVHALGLERPLIEEWAPLWAAHIEWELRVVFVVSLLLGIYAAAVASRRWPAGLLLIILSAWFAASSMRLAAIYAIVWISIVPAWLRFSELERVLERTVARLARPLGVLAIVAATALIVGSMRRPLLQIEVPTTRQAHGPYYPAGATDYLQRNGFRGNLMTFFDVGAFVSWKLHPKVRVGMDSRYEVAYPPDALIENVRLYSGAHGWQEVLERYPTDAVLVHTGSRLDTLLASPSAQTSSIWKAVYRDDGFTIYAGTERAASLPRIDLRGATPGGAFP